MCALIPVLAGICVPARGMPMSWFWIDFSFASAAALPLWIALRDIRRVERLSEETAQGNLTGSVQSAPR